MSHHAPSPYKQGSRSEGWQVVRMATFEHPCEGALSIRMPNMIELFHVFDIRPHDGRLFGYMIDVDGSRDSMSKHVGNQVACRP